MKRFITILLSLMLAGTVQAQIKMDRRTGARNSYNITNSGDNWTIERDGANLKLADTLVYVSKSSDDLASIISNLNGIQRYVIINKTIDCNGAGGAPITTPTGINFFVTPSGTFYNTDSVVFRGTVFAPRTQLFTNTAHYHKIRLMRNAEVYPEWWGAVTDDGSNDRAAINFALRSVSQDPGTVLLDQGRYNIQSSFLEVPSYTKLKGTHSISIDSAGMYNGSNIHFETTPGLQLHSQTELSNIYFTMGAVSGSQAYVSIANDSMVTIENCTFIGTQSTGSCRTIQVNPGKSIYIHKNVFVNTGKSGYATIDVFNPSATRLMDVFEITDNYFLDLVSYPGIRFNATNPGPKSQNINIEHNHFKVLDVLAIPTLIDINAEQVRIHNNSFRSFDISNVTAIKISGGQNIAITTNSFDRLDYAANFYAGDHIIFADNVIDSCGVGYALTGTSSCTKVSIVNNVLTPTGDKLVATVFDDWFVWGNQDGVNEQILYRDLYISNDDSSELHFTWGTHTGFTLGFDRVQDSLYIRYDNPTYTDPGYDLFTIDHVSSGLFRNYFNFDTYAPSFYATQFEVQETTGGTLAASILSDDIDPEGAKTAAVGSIYLRRGQDRLEKGLYYKETGSGAAGWNNMYTNFKTGKATIESVNGAEGAVFFDKETQDATHIRWLAGHKTGDNLDFSIRSYDGATTADEIRIEPDNNRVLFDNNKLGLGTTTPTSAITVLNGDIRVEDGAFVLVDTSATPDWSVGVYTGEGSPEGALAANQGSLYLRSDGGSGTTVYRKESGIGNTGWTDETVDIKGYGTLYASNISETLTMYMNIWAQITNATSTLLTLPSAYSNVSISSDMLTLTYAGDYQWTLHVSFSGTAADTYEFTVAINGTPQNVGIISTSGTDTESGSVCGTISVGAGATVYLAIRNTASNDDATIKAVSFAIHRL